MGWNERRIHSARGIIPRSGWRRPVEHLLRPSASRRPRRHSHRADPFAQNLDAKSVSAHVEQELMRRTPQRQDSQTCVDEKKEVL
jgi:hypothetical protein